METIEKTSQIEENQIYNNLESRANKEHEEPAANKDNAENEEINI